jgi:hypothetical protein
VLHPVDDRAIAFGAAVSAVVERLDRVPRLGQALRDVLVAAQVLGDAVRDDDDGPGIGGRRPGAGEDLQATDTGEADQVSFAIGTPAIFPGCGSRWRGA